MCFLEINSVIISVIIDFFTNKWKQLVSTGIIILFALILLLLSKVIVKGLSKKSNNRVKTLTRLLRSVINYAVIIICIILILGIWEFNIAPILAGAGIITLVVGLGAQDLIKDLLAGFNIIFENYYELNDVVEINGFKGSVSEIGLKSTVLYNWKGEVKIIANREITTVINYSKMPSVGCVDISVSYDTNISKALSLLVDNLSKINELYPQIVEGPNVMGVTDLAESGVTIRITVKTQPNEQYAVEREIRKFVKELFDENGIEIPFKQIVIHNAKD